MTFLPDDVYALIERSVPIACVDFVPTRVALDGRREVGLIQRDSPFGRVWCHLGGRVQHGETIVGALRRHARDTLNVGLVVEPNAQPAYVYEWFPPEVAPTDGTSHGADPRKHSIGLSFVVDIDGAPTPQNEALDFGYFDASALPEPMWPGSAELIELLQRQSGAFS
ncbi:NUDIX hydrolase [Microbacterium sp. NPDC079995]|uniref:NUDIX hydrolase n=1 Tax=unclassified Microbacterium TaxID=2609290 RepID=UPI00344D52CE